MNGNLDIVKIELSALVKELEKGKENRYQYIDKYLNIPLWEKEALKRSFSLLLDNYKQIIIIQKRLLNECRESKVWLIEKLRNEINSKAKPIDLNSKFSNN